MVKAMRSRRAVFLFLTLALVAGGPAAARAAVTFYANTNASATSSAPLRNSSVGQVFIPAVSGNAHSIAIRTVPGGNGSVDCSHTIEDSFHIVRPMYLMIWPFDAAVGQPSLNAYAYFAASSTAPDANGNCFYTFYNTGNFFNTAPGYSTASSSKGTLSDAALVAGQPYFVAFDDQILNWRSDIFGGSPSGAGAGYFNWIPPLQSNDFNHANFFLGGVGVSSYFMTISDTPGFVSDHNAGTSGTSTPPAEPPPSPSDPCANGSCASNVLFLPGIEGSRLYEGTGCGKSGEEKLWEPIGDDAFMSVVFRKGDAKVGRLALNADGASVCDDIYTKPGDVIDAVQGDAIYRSLLNEFNSLKSADTINDWKPAAYDWRFSLDDLLAKGTARDGRIYYEEATGTPYIEQTLRALAASSKTGKVTIVAHSNGGLVAKALLKKLGEGANGLVDRLVLVASPQSGVPAGAASLLVGYGAGIYKDVKNVKNAVMIVSNAAAQAFSQNSPMAYHLLPSEYYLESTAGDAAHPVARFSGDAYASEEAAYGGRIGNRAALASFIKGYDKDARPDLLDYAARTHDALDGWTPPPGIEVDQIAGWGVDTVAGIDFYSSPNPALAGPLATDVKTVRSYRPIFTEDGDGTVPIPSALLMASSTNVRRYWLDLNSYNKNSHTSIKHADIFEIPSLQDLIKNLIENSTSTPSGYMLTKQPPALDSDKKLFFFLHSPLTLQVSDMSGNTTGVSVDGSVSEDIPSSSYGEFGEVKYVSVPESGSYTLSMQGQGSGTFSLDLQENAGGEVARTTTIANVPVTPSTSASMTVSGGLNTVSALLVDPGEGGKAIVIEPKVGETMNYKPSPTLESESKAQPASPSVPEPKPNGSISIPVITPPASVASSESVPAEATSTQKSFVLGQVQENSVSGQAATEAIVTSTPVESGPGAGKSQTSHPAPRSLTSSAPEERVPVAVAPQPAAAVAAVSQHSVTGGFAGSVYNVLHTLWLAITKLF